MDFFEYAAVASYFTNTLWAILLVGGLCFAIVFVFQAVALFIIASREGYKQKWMAFVPCLNTYYIGVCAQKNRFYRLNTKGLAIAVAAVEFVLVGLYVLSFVAGDLVSDYIVESYRDLGYGKLQIWTAENAPANLAWAAWIYNNFDTYLNLADLAFRILKICLLICFFQTYACRRYVLFSVTSILFPIQGILFFVVRNNKGINYRDFLRNEQARQYAMYQQYQQQQNYNNPYNGNPYNRNPYDNTPPDGGAGRTPPDDPFSGFGSDGGESGNQGASPFDEFDDKN